MKKTRVMASLLVMLCLSLMPISVFAAEERSSDQISQYSIQAIPIPGKINVTFFIQGPGIVDKIGCESIEVFEKEGTQWEPTESYFEDDDGMSVTNSLRHKNTILCDAESGVEDKIVVTVFAENDAGRDTRSQTFYVTGK